MNELQLLICHPPATENRLTKKEQLKKRRWGGTEKEQLNGTADVKKKKSKRTAFDLSPEG